MRQNHIFLKEMRTPPYQTQHLTSLPTLSLISLCVHVERLNVVTGTSMQRSILWILMPWMTKAAYMTPQEIHHFGAQCRVRLLAQALLPCHSSIISRFLSRFTVYQKWSHHKAPKTLLKRDLTPKHHFKNVIWSQCLDPSCVYLLCVFQEQACCTQPATRGDSLNSGEGGSWRFSETENEMIHWLRDARLAPACEESIMWKRRPD